MIKHLQLIGILIYNANKYCAATVRLPSLELVWPNSIGSVAGRVRRPRSPLRTWRRQKRWSTGTATTANRIPKVCQSNRTAAKATGDHCLPPVRGASGPGPCFSCTAAVCCPAAGESGPRPSVEVWNWTRPADIGCTSWSGSTCENFPPAPAATGTTRPVTTPSDWGKRPDSGIGDVLKTKFLF